MSLSTIVIEIHYPVLSSASSGLAATVRSEAPAKQSNAAGTEPLDNPVCLRDLDSIAHRKVSKAAWDFWSSGAMDCETRDLNLSAFSKIRIRPRVLRDVSVIDTSVSLFGHTYASPIVISPTAFMKMGHPEGERAVGRAAASLNQVQTLSTFTSYSLEEVAEGVRSLPDYPFAKSAKIPNLWFQLYIVQDRVKTAEITRRAEAAGYSAVVFTVDSPQVGRRLHMHREPWVIPADAAPGNFLGARSARHTHDPTINWESEIGFIRSITKLPLIMKGIMTAEDAEMAVKAGADAIAVSNHGGRQLDSIPAAIEALPEVVRAVKGRIPVMVDGGIRKGTDVFKCLALGARFVCVGRPSLYSLAWDGEDGVRKMLGWLNEELRLSMVLAGTTDHESITREYVRHEAEYFKL